MSEDKKSDKDKKLNSEEKENLEEEKREEGEKQIPSKEEVEENNEESGSLQTQEEAKKILEGLTSKILIAPSLERIVENETLSHKEDTSEKEVKKKVIQEDYIVNGEKKDERNYNPKVLDSDFVGTFSKNSRNFNPINPGEINIKEFQPEEEYNPDHEYTNELESQRELLKISNVNMSENVQDRYKRFKFR